MRERRGSLFRPGSAAASLFWIAVIVWLGSGVMPSPAQETSRNLALCLGVLGLIFARVHKTRSQAQRDGELTLDGPIALFLRPFFFDKRLRLSNPFTNRWFPFFSLPTYDGLLLSLSPSEYVGRILEPYINVRQFGGDAADFANARIPVPRAGDWREDVKLQLTGATIVVIIPLLLRLGNGDRPYGSGSMWELSHLLESGKLESTIAIMPRVGWVNRKTIERGWERARAEALSLGLKFPPYNARGDVFIFERKRDIWRVATPFRCEAGINNYVAINLIEALKWLSKRHKFALLDR